MIITVHHLEPGRLGTYHTIQWSQHDDVGAVLVPDHLPELGSISLLRTVSHDEELGSEVGIDVVGIVLMRSTDFRV